MDILVSRKPNIIVMGDVMLDHNVKVHPNKIANEAPILVFNKEADEILLGGCGNVLENLYNLGCGSLHVFTAHGNDRNGEILQGKLAAIAKPHYTVIEDHPTTTKQRFFCQNKIMFRCDDEKQLKHTPETINLIMTELEKVVAEEAIDVIVLSDYNKGYLSKELCIRIIQLANDRNIFTVVDPKEDYHKYIGCSLIKPNKKEAYNLFGMKGDVDIKTVHAIIQKETGAKYSIVTLAEEGITIASHNEYVHERTEVKHIIDVTGAGDIVCAILSYLFAIERDIKLIAKIATFVATRSVSEPGAYKLSQKDILDAFSGAKGKVNTIESIMRSIVGKRTVFTNGCFDIIHKGHVDLFKFCKSHGDVVIVGLNSDDSIRRLKGSTRPVNNVKNRLAVLEALECVDYIVVFDDDTPYEVIKRIRPDVLVKGGDYVLETIVGREFSKEVKIFNTIEGYSTTSIIERAQIIGELL